MYRILIADDEGLMLEAFKGVILAEFGDKCSVETAKTGRAVIEKAETFHPDIVFMDIHMPGINGIQAMREIRKFNNSALFYVVSAYDKFDYAKEAINLGVEQYLTKPISKSKIISVVEEATAKVDKVRDQRSNLLKIQEKLETVIPVVESGYVNSLLFQKEMAAADYYQQLLDIEYGQGYVMVVQFGQSYENGRLVSPVGMNVKAQSFYPEFRDVVKSAFPCVVGNIMSNRIPVVVPCEIFQNPYEDRIDLVEKARELLSQAGYPDGKGFPVLTYKYPSLELDADTAQVIQEQLKQNLNIEIKLEAQELQTNYATRRAGNFDLCRMNWTADFADPYTYLSMLLSNGTYNCSGVRDEKYDRLVEASDVETDPVKRNALLHEAEQWAVGEQFYIIPLFSMKSCNLIRPDITGVSQIPATGALEYRYADVKGD